MSKVYDVIVLGAGPAGLAAGLYAGRSRLSTLVIEKGKDGGQIAITDDIENYPGQIVEGESGPSLIARMTQQCEKFGVERASDVINEVHLDGDIKVLKSAKAENVMAKAGKGWSTIGKETLLDMNPDVIFLENGGADVKSVLQDSALSSLNAVKKKQVYEFPSPLETWDTPNLSSCLGALWAYATLYPDNLSMDTVKQEAKDFYRTFYHIEVKDSDLGL